MMRASKRALIELISDLVNESGSTWRERRESLLTLASNEERTAIEEFASWFDPVEG